jgi:hypothetical protein
MLYREEKIILYQGNMKERSDKLTGMESDDYWTKNYPGKPSERNSPLWAQQ